MSNATSTGGSGVYVLDTSILVLSLRGDIGIQNRLAATTTLYIPSAALGELYDGAYGSPTQTDAALLDVATLAVTNKVLGTDAVTADIYGRIKQELKQRGLFMPDNDLWIAAIAVQYDTASHHTDVESRPAFVSASLRGGETNHNGVTRQGDAQFGEASCAFRPSRPSYRCWV